jgi:hypothetical protein
MRPRKTENSNMVYSLPGGNEDNDMHCQRLKPGSILSVWDFTDEERKLIAEGYNVELVIYTEPIPPVSMAVTPAQAKVT